MVCSRCIAAVNDILARHSIPVEKIELGEVLLAKPLKNSQKELLQKDLTAMGFELIDDRKTQVIERIKKLILIYISELPSSAHIKLSAYLSEKIHYEYSYLSDLFSSVEGSTVEHYFISQRIEKVKELLVYDQLSLSQIADDLGFSSVHHLSTQFKRTTGLTPSHFKTLGAAKRRQIDKI